MKSLGLLVILRLKGVVPWLFLIKRPSETDFQSASIGWLVVLLLTAL